MSKVSALIHATYHGLAFSFVERGIFNASICFISLLNEARIYICRR